MKFRITVGLALLSVSHSAFGFQGMNCEQARAHIETTEQKLDRKRYDAALECKKGPQGNWTIADRDAFLERMDSERGYYSSGPDHGTYGQKPYADIPDRIDNIPDTMTIDEADRIGRMEQNRAHRWAGCNALIDNELLLAIMEYEGLGTLKMEVRAYCPTSSQSQREGSEEAKDGSAQIERKAKKKVPSVLGRVLGF